MNAVWLLMLIGNIFAGFRPDGSSNDASPVIYESEQLEELIKQQCQNVTGDENAFQALMSFKDQDTLQCIWQHLKCSLVPLEKIPTEERRYCGPNETALNCLNPLVEKTIPCMFDEKSVKIVQKIVNSSQKAFRTIYKAFCPALNEIVFRTCVTKMSQDINNCTYLIGDEWIKKDFGDYSLKDCSELIEMSNCYRGMASNCGGPPLRNIFNLFYSNVRSLTPCRIVVRNEYRRGARHQYLNSKPSDLVQNVRAVPFKVVPEF